MKKKLYRGQWGGLSARTVARLMGCHECTAKIELYKLKNYYKRMPELEEVGELIHHYKTRKQYDDLDKLFKI